MVRQRDTDFLDDEAMEVDGDSNNSSDEGEEGDFHGDEEQFQQRVKERERKREVMKVANSMIRASNTKKGFITEDEVNKLFPDANMRTKEAKDHRDKTIIEASHYLSKEHGVEIVRDEAKPNRRAYYLCEIEPMLIEDPHLKEKIKRRHETKPAEEAYKDGILYRALMYIFMKLRHMVADEPGVNSKAFKDFMEKIGVEEEDFSKYFGPVKSEFVAQGFIKYVLVGESEEYINWGDRANKVVDKGKLLAAFCEIYGTKMTQWPNHMREAGLDPADFLPQ